jgi:hypothetical protein
VKNYSPSSIALDTRIAGHKTVADWLKLRLALIKDQSSTENWKEAYNFFRLRIDTRFIKPIDSILAINQRLGEGHSASALQCVLLEFLEALRQGKIYRPPFSPEAISRKATSLGISTATLDSHMQPHEYTSSASLFVSFLTTQKPFSDVFTKRRANTFYRDIRCGLLHEAATKSGSKVRAAKDGDPRCLMEPTSNGLIVYRTPFHKALLNWIEALRSRLQEDHVLQQNFLRKMDDIAQVRRCFYFAYGSNMKTDRLLSRIGCIHSTRVARLDGYRFQYNKKSDDGSAKANVSRPGDAVWGVCYEIDLCDFERLQQYEKGYEPTEVWTYDGNKKSIVAKTFVSKSLTMTKPSAKYVTIVVCGAREHGLPGNYIRERLENNKGQRKKGRRTAIQPRARRR